LKRQLVEITDIWTASNTNFYNDFDSNTVAFKRGP